MELNKPMNLNRLRVLAGLEPIVESMELPAETPENGPEVTPFFVYGRMQRKSAVLEAANIDKAVENFAKAPVKQVVHPEVVSIDDPAHFIDKDGNEYVSFPKGGMDGPKETDTFESEEKAMDALFEAKEKAHDSDFPKVTFMNDNPPANKLTMTRVEFSTDTVEVDLVKQGIDIERASKVKVPADVMAQLNKRIAELKSAIETYDEKGYDDKSVKTTVIACLEKIKSHLEKGNQEEYRMAQVYYGTLMGPIIELFPTKLINFLHSGKDNLLKLV
jgi:hypothetical protein